MPHRVPVRSAESPALYRSAEVRHHPDPEAARTRSELRAGAGIVRPAVAARGQVVLSDGRDPLRWAGPRENRRPAGVKTYAAGIIARPGPENSRVSPSG